MCPDSPLQPPQNQLNHLSNAPSASGSSPSVMSNCSSSSPAPPSSSPSPQESPQKNCTYIYRDWLIHKHSSQTQLNRQTHKKHKKKLNNKHSNKSKSTNELTGLISKRFVNFRHISGKNLLTRKFLASTGFLSSHNNKSSASVNDHMMSLDANSLRLFYQDPRKYPYMLAIQQPRTTRSQNFVFAKCSENEDDDEDMESFY